MFISGCLLYLCVGAIARALERFQNLNVRSAPNGGKIGIGDVMHIGVDVFGSPANGTGSGEGAGVGERD